MIQQILSALIVLSLIIFPVFHASHADELIRNNTSPHVYFSLNGGYTNATVSQINNSRSEVFVLARSFTSAHNKFMIIDKETVITGSFNFTKATEEKYAENLLIIRNKNQTKICMDNWYKHKAHSEI